jgi:hypothetical protein
MMLGAEQPSEKPVWDTINFATDVPRNTIQR